MRRGCVMAKWKGLADFIRPHCAITEGEPDRYVRVKIGKTRTGKGSRTLDIAPMYLSGRIAEVRANEIEATVARATAGERPEYRLWYEILEKGGTHPLEDGISDPQPIPYPAAEDESDGDDSTSREGLDRVVGHVITGLMGMAEQAGRRNREIDESKDREIARLSSRIETLEGMVVEQINKRIEAATSAASKELDLREQKTIAETRAMIAEAGIGEDSEGMEQAIELAKEILPKAFQAWQAKQAPPESKPTTTDGQPPPDSNPSEPSPGDELDAYMAATAEILSSHHELLTQERWDKFKAAYMQISALASFRGLK